MDTNLYVCRSLLITILPSVHQDGPAASSHTTLIKLEGFVLMDNLHEPMRFTLRRVNAPMTFLFE